MSDELKTTTYADSGVDIDAGTEAVRQMKKHIRSTFNANVVADVGVHLRGGENLPRCK